MKMYVWTREDFSVVAHAESVDQARGRALAELAEKCLMPGPREEISRCVEREMPCIWIGPNAEVDLRNSGEVRDLREEIDVLTEKLKEKDRTIKKLEKTVDEYAKALTD